MLWRIFHRSGISRLPQSLKTSEGRITPEVDATSVEAKVSALLSCLLQISADSSNVQFVLISAPEKVLASWVLCSFETDAMTEWENELVVFNAGDSSKSVWGWSIELRNSGRINESNELKGSKGSDKFWINSTCWEVDKTSLSSFRDVSWTSDGEKFSKNPSLSENDLFWKSQSNCRSSLFKSWSVKFEWFKKFESFMDFEWVIWYESFVRLERVWPLKENDDCSLLQVLIDLSGEWA